MRFLVKICAIALVGTGTSAWAGETPRYEPSPGWVHVLPMPAANNPDSPAVVLSDTQERIEGTRLWTYTDQVTRVATPDELAKLTTLTLPWIPDKGDLIIHELSILRDGRRIDLLANGKKFAVIRREESLEQLEITGILTATLQVEGLQVGDALRLRMSTTSQDAALAGHVQGAEVLTALPTKVGELRLRVSWPKASPVQWKMLAVGAAPQIADSDGFTSLEVKLPLDKQPDMPADAPLRFRHPLFFEFADFKDWREVSRVMAPLYRTSGTIVPGSALAVEVAAIEKADATPIGRAELALELVQDKIRYLAVVMNGGNYVPQAPERTWQLRYGDCKAKTLLLLSLLHAMNIDAEPVLAASQLGDLVPDRLASAAAFDHVLVRAQIDGASLWLDGTGRNARLADIHDTPPFEHVLPIRPAGSDLLTIVTHANARPTVEILIDADESTSSDLPSAVTMTALLRGGLAAQMAQYRGNIDDKTLREAAKKSFAPVLGDDVQIADATLDVNQADGTTAIVAHGVASSSWVIKDRKIKRDLLIDNRKQNFDADRSRPAWSSIPVATDGPISGRYRLRLRLPDGGKGATVEGDANFDGIVAGTRFMRHVTLANGTVDVDERGDRTRAEIPAAKIPAERTAAALMKSRQPRIVAGPDSLRWWNITAADRKGATQLAALEHAYAAIAANDPNDTYGLVNLAYIHELVLDRKIAVEELNTAIAREPSVDLYLRRATDEEDLGSYDTALADANAARALDPSSSDANERTGWLLARRGDLTGAVALMDEQIAKGGETADDYSADKAEMIGIFGDAQEGIRQIGELIEKKPSQPNLLDNRCWIKATRSIMLDTALKDCTKAIELSSDSSSPLDSRAMTWFRMGRYDDALRDLDAVLADAPGYAQSHFLRAVVLERLHRNAEAAKDLAAARNISPSIDRYNAAYGLHP